MSGFCRSHQTMMRTSYSPRRYSIGDSSEHPSYWDDDERHEPTLVHLEDSGYEFDQDSGEWCKLLSSTQRTCKRDHKNGRVKAGQRYLEHRYLYIIDNPDSEHHRSSRRERKVTVLCDKCDSPEWYCKRHPQTCVDKQAAS